VKEAAPAVVPDPVDREPVAPLPSKNPKAKTTLSLQDLLKPSSSVAAADKPMGDLATVVNEKVSIENLRAAWDEFAESRKGQAAEHQIMKREYNYEYPVIEVLMTNPVEETLLDNFRHDLIQFLRDRLRNNGLTVVATLKEASGKKVLYTSKEKFEHLAEKNPYLNELKERLGLDWDF
jgi:DNA polymerase-3 subunit gamma/tau